MSGATRTHPLLRYEPWVAIVCLARVFLFANFMVVAASIPVLIEEWDMSATQAGSIVSSFTIGYALSLFAFSWYADRFGARRVTLVSAWASAAAAMAFALFARDYPSAALLYGLAGLAQGGTYTPVIMLFSERYNPSLRGTVVGWLIASTSVGYATSLLVSGVALNIGGYQAAFVATGVLPLVGAAILHLSLRGTPNTIHARSTDLDLKAVLVRDANTRRLVTGYTAHTWELLGMWAWLPAFLAASLALQGFATVEAAETGAYVSSAGHIVGAIASLVMGSMSDRLGRRTVLVGVAALGAVLSLSVGWMIALPIAVLGVVALVYSFSVIGDSPVLSAGLTETVPPAFLGSALAVRSLLGFGAGAVAPLVFGLMLDLTSGGSTPGAVAWGVSFGLLGIGGLIAVISALRLDGQAQARPGEAE